MEAFKLKTLEDLFDTPEERVELIDGALVQRPMALMEHGFVQASRLRLDASAMTPAVPRADSGA